MAGSAAKNEAWPRATAKSEMFNLEFYKEGKKKEENKLIYIEWQKFCKLFSIPHFCFSGFPRGFTLKKDWFLHTSWWEENKESWVWVQGSQGPGGKGWAKDSTFYERINLLAEEKRSLCSPNLYLRYQKGNNVSSVPTFIFSLIHTYNSHSCNPTKWGECVTHWEVF